MSRKNKNSAAPAVIEAPAAIETAPAPEGDTLPPPPAELVIEAPAESEAAPEAPASRFRPVEKTAPGFARITEKDSFGFSVGSFTARIAALLATEEGADKPTLLREALDVTEESAPSVRKARLTTLSVFLSDSKRPFGTYPVSRAFIIETDGSNYRIAPESAEKARAAIVGGILSALREAKTESARKAVLARFGYSLS